MELNKEMQNMQQTVFKSHKFNKRKREINKRYVVRKDILDCGKVEFSKPKLDGITF